MKIHLRHTAILLSAMPLIAVSLLTGCREPGKARPQEQSASHASTQSSTRITARKNTPLVRSNRTPGRNSTGRATSSSATSGTHVYGRVLHADSKPAAGSTVTLLGFIGKPQYELNDLASTVTSADGTYSLRSPAGRINYLSVQGDHAPVQASLASDNAPPARNKGTIERNITLRGSHAQAGVVLNERGQPVAGASVYLQPNEDPQTSGIMPIVLETTSTASGEFLFSYAVAGSAVCGARVTGYAPATVQADVPSSEPITLRIGNRGATVIGTVLMKETNAPVPDLQLNLLPSDSGQLFKLASQIVTTDQSGRFTFDQVSTGSKRIGLLPVDPPRLGLTVPPPPEINLAEGQTTDVVLYVTAGYTLSGQVYDKKTSTPIAGAKVTASATAKSGAVSDDYGKYSITNILVNPEAEIFLSATTAGYVIDSGPSRFGDISGIRIPVSPDILRVEQDIPMVPTLTVSGQVVTKDDVPVRAGNVQFINLGEIETPASVPLADDGTFSLNVAPGKDGYVKALADGFAPAESKVLQIDDQDVPGVKVIVSSGCTVSGVVLLPDGTPAPGAEIIQRVTRSNFMGGSVSYLSVTKSDAAGKFRLTEVQRDVEFSARLKPYADSEYAVLTMEPAELRTDVILQLHDGTEISGRVLDIKHRPLESVSVDVVGSTEKTSDRSDSNGEFALKNLREGKYNVQATGPAGRTIVSDVATGTSGLEIVLGEPDVYTLVGTVLDEVSSKPVINFSIEGHDVVPLPDGKFVLERLNKKSPLQLKISSPAHRAQSFTVIPPDNKPTLSQTFTLGSDGVISGRIVEIGTLKPLAGVSVTAWDGYSSITHDGIPLGRTQTEADGRFILGPMHSGEQVIHIQPGRPFSDTYQNVTVKSEQNNDLGDIEVTGDGIIRGQVVQGSGNTPVPGILVYCGMSKNGKPELRSVTADAQGRFEFKDVAGPMCTLRVETTFQQVKVDSSKPADVLLRRGSTTMKGRITRAGKGISMGLTAEASDQYYRANSSDGGLYTIESMAPGTYTFKFRDKEETVEVPDQPEFVKDFNLP